MKIGLVAGEASGDVLGAGLIRAIRARFPDATFEGVAGAKMVEAGELPLSRAFDGKRLQTDQLYWDRQSDWIFTEGRFTMTNPEEGTVLNGQGMDFNRDFTYFNAHKTGGEMLVKEEEEEI